MATTISAIRDGLKVRLQTITALANRSHDVWPNANINCPAVLVKPLALSVKQAMGGKRVRTFEILLLAAPIGPDTARAQDELDSYLDDTGATSIIVALEGDKTLGGIVTTLDVSWGDYGGVELPPGSGTIYLGAKFEVTVWD